MGEIEGEERVMIGVRGKMRVKRGLNISEGKTLTQVSAGTGRRASIGVPCPSDAANLHATSSNLLMFFYFFIRLFFNYL